MLPDVPLAMHHPTKLPKPKERLIESTSEEEDIHLHTRKRISKDSPNIDTSIPIPIPPPVIHRTQPELPKLVPQPLYNPHPQQLTKPRLVVETQNLPDHQGILLDIAKWVQSPEILEEADQEVEEEEEDQEVEEVEEVEEDLQHQAQQQEQLQPLDKDDSSNSTNQVNSLETQHGSNHGSSRSISISIPINAPMTWIESISHLDSCQEQQEIGNKITSIDDHKEKLGEHSKTHLTKPSLQSNRISKQKKNSIGLDNEADTSKNTYQTSLYSFPKPTYPTAYHYSPILRKDSIQQSDTKHFEEILEPSRNGKKQQGSHIKLSLNNKDSELDKVLDEVLNVRHHENKFEDNQTIMDHTNQALDILISEMNPLPTETITQGTNGTWKLTISTRSSTNLTWTKNKTTRILTNCTIPTKKILIITKNTTLTRRKSITPLKEDRAIQTDDLKELKEPLITSSTMFSQTNNDKPLEEANASSVKRRDISTEIVKQGRFTLTPQERNQWQTDQLHELLDKPTITKSKKGKGRSATTKSAKRTPMQWYTM